MKKVLLLIILIAASILWWRHQDQVKSYSSRMSGAIQAFYRHLTQGDPPPPPPSSPAAPPPLPPSEARLRLQSQIQDLDRKIAMLKTELQEAEKAEAAAKEKGKAYGMKTTSGFLRNEIYSRERERLNLQKKLDAIPAPP